VGVGVWAVVPGLWRWVMEAQDLPQWDMAKYGVSGLRLAEAVRDIDLPGWIREVDALDVWPPVFPLVESFAVLVFGPGFRVGELLNVVLFAAAACAAFWAGWEVERWAGAGRAAVAGVLAAALWLASPFTRLFATLTMLEVPGALALLVAVALYARWLRRRRVGDLRAAALAAVVVFFTKYNYGLLWIAPLLLHEAWDEHGTMAALGRRLRGAVEAVAWRRPWTVFLVLYGLVLLSIPLTGGWRFELAGVEVAASSLGNPVYALYVIVLARLALLPAARRRAVARWRGLPERCRVLGRWIGLPVAAWMLVPDHTKNFFGFVENRASGLSLAGHLAAYPRSFVADYHAAEWLGWAVAAAALVPLLRLRRLPPERRAVGLALLLGLAAALLHPYKEPRFLFTVVPLAWLMAAAGVAEAVDQLAHRLPVRGWPLPRAAVAAFAVALVAAGGLDAGRLGEARALYAVDAAARPLLEAVAQEARRAAAAPVLVGYWNELSPALVEWRLRQAGERPPPVPLAPQEMPGWSDPAAVLQGTLEEGRPLLVLEVLGRRAACRDAFRAETARLDPLRDAVAADPRFRRRRTHRFGAAGWRLRVYLPRPAEAAALVPARADPIH
jgi:hypothetical protein